MQQHLKEQKKAAKDDLKKQKEHILQQEKKLIEDYELKLA